MWQWFCSGSFKGGAFGPVEHFLSCYQFCSTCWVIHVLPLSSSSDFCMRPIFYRIGYQGETKILTQLSFIHNWVVTVLVTPLSQGCYHPSIFFEIPIGLVIHWVGTSFFLIKTKNCSTNTLLCFITCLATTLGKPFRLSLREEPLKFLYVKRRSSFPFAYWLGERERERVYFPPLQKNLCVEITLRYHHPCHDTLKHVYDKNTERMGWFRTQEM
jgi:hypothetical protein